MLFDGAPVDAAPVEDKKSNSLIDNLKEFAPSIDLVSGKYAGSVIGPELLIEGLLESSGLIEIFGTINGDIRGAAVTIGESGVVNGSIEAKILMVNGKVTGDLVASEVELGPKAHVEGNIHQRTIIMAKGAHFEGRSTRMAPAKETVVPDQRPATPRPAPQAANEDSKPMPLTDPSRKVGAKREARTAA